MICLNYTILMEIFQQLIKKRGYTSYDLDETLEFVILFFLIFSLEPLDII